jgi:hypothetical protein
MAEHYPEFLQAAEQRRREKDRARAAVVDHLHSFGVQQSIAAGAWLAARLAVDRHAEKIAEQHAEKIAKQAGRGIKKIYDDKVVKMRVEKIARAAAKLIEAIEGAPHVVWANISEAYATPRDEDVDKQVARGRTRGEVLEKAAQNARRLNEEWRQRIGPRSQFSANVRVVRDSADDALARLKRNGRPTSARAALVDELAVIWRRATGEMPGGSGAGDFDDPHSDFGRFVKVVVVAATARPSDFKNGFAELIVSAADRYKKRNQAQVAKASEKI